MGEMKPIGMRTSVREPGAMIINTCAQNDTDALGNKLSWSWCNPTNRRFNHVYHGYVAVSVECLWQGTKVFAGLPHKPTLSTMAGRWRDAKRKRPLGAYAGEGEPLITTPGEARRRIYIPAYKRQIELWREFKPEINDWIAEAMERGAYVRDHDTGQGIDQPGPMSHAWLLIEILEGRV